jgi:DNA invertase Pin-like site-specific DNA recombinase
MNAAVWCRVSSSSQDTDNQLIALSEWAERRGLSVTTRYAVEASAFTGKQNPYLNIALKDARLGKFSVLLVSALDRLSRGGIEDLLSILRRFRERGVMVLSLNEPWTDGGEAMGDLLCALMGWVAERESALRSARVRAGQARYVAQGGKLGRAKGAKDKTKRKVANYYRRYERERENRR